MFNKCFKNDKFKYYSGHIWVNRVCDCVEIVTVVHSQLCVSQLVRRSALDRKAPEDQLPEKLEKFALIAAGCNSRGSAASRSEE